VKTKHGTYTGAANFLRGFKVVAEKATRTRRLRKPSLGNLGGGPAGAGDDDDDDRKSVEKGVTWVDTNNPRVVDPFAAGRPSGHKRSVRHSSHVSSAADEELSARFEGKRDPGDPMVVRAFEEDSSLRRTDDERSTHK
jgi:hypothetical protein